MAIGIHMHAGALCLVLLSSVQVTALDCNFLKVQQQRFNLQSLKLWKERSAKFPSACLKELTAFSFPSDILEISESRLAMIAVYEILHGFLNILRRDLLGTGLEVTQRKRFLQMLHAQTEVIERCLEERKVTLRGAKGRKTVLRLKRYFQRIITFIREKERGTCIWESLQLEIRTSFTYIDILTKRMNS
ncbi:interferon epsilon-like [Rhineura floridana]|uniref:interferon epsilon-like n=1 Tax=Rhineura floridana TaxID=261503 RepID=UPI002AC874BD|nr:interferon epsilon-like [Rhineura floridana]